MELLVSGADMLDGTPVYDIKPYLSFSDSHPEALNGFAEQTKDHALEVRSGGTQCTKESLAAEWGLPLQVAEDIIYILRQDPRPAYQEDSARNYKMDYGGWCVTFSVEAQAVCVKKIEKMQK
jgi:hypothetical protein